MNAQPRESFGVVKRRGFFGWVTAALGALAGGVFAVPYVGYLLGPLRRSPVHWVTLGAVNDFPPHETRLATFSNPLEQPWDGQTAQTGVYVRGLGPDARGETQFLIFAINCTHLGCPVTWFAESGLFMCPCHGGVYYEDGERASGPPPRGLYHCQWRIADGRLQVQAPHLPTLQHTLRES